MHIACIGVVGKQGEPLVLRVYQDGLAMDALDTVVDSEKDGVILRYHHIVHCSLDLVTCFFFVNMSKYKLIPNNFIVVLCYYMLCIDRRATQTARDVRCHGWLCRRRAQGLNVSRISISYRGISSLWLRYQHAC